MSAGKATAESHGSDGLSAPSAPSISAASGAAGRWKILLLAGVLVAGIALVHATPLRSLLSDWRSWRERLEAFGWAAPLIFTFLVAALVAVGCPRLLLCSIGGLVFGFFRGLLGSQIGTLAGCYGTFVFVRWAGREAALRKWPLLSRYAERLERGGWSTVVLARLLPISGLFVNATLGLTRVSHWEFLLASAVGLLPEAIPAVLIGAGLSQSSPARTLVYVAIALLIFIAAWVAVVRYRRSAAVAGPGACLQGRSECE